MEPELFPFQLFWKVYIVISFKKEKFKLDLAHCAKYQKGLSILWKSSLLILWNIYSKFLQLSLQISGDFRKSFHNLPNFFREHAPGARAIFHLCMTEQLFPLHIRTMVIGCQYLGHYGSYNIYTLHYSVLVF